MKLRKKKEREQLSVCANCGAMATDGNQLCEPQVFQGDGGCSPSKTSFRWFPVHGNCEPPKYVCTRCGREALAGEYLCDAAPLG
jgi:hypothetical protein